MELSSLKTLEYLACGLPTYSTRVPGQDLIEEHGLGMLVPFEKVVTEFGKFLDNLPVYRTNLERYRASTGKQHSWDRAALETHEFLMSVLGAEDA